MRKRVSPSLQPGSIAKAVSPRQSLERDHEAAGIEGKDIQRASVQYHCGVSLPLGAAVNR